MNNLLHQQIDELLAKSDTRAKLECKRALRIAAATLCRAPSGEITATTVVCDIADDEIDTIQSLASGIAAEYGLEVSIQQQSGSGSVRFTRPEPDEPMQSMAAEKSFLARLLGR